MSKWANFVISAVRRGPELGKISQVQIHEDRGEDFGPPQIVDKQIVASDIKKGNRYITISVSYTHLTLPTILLV